MEVIKQWTMTVQDTGKQISFTRRGERESVCQVFIDHDVGCMHGIQGENFFRAIAENIDEMFNIVKYYVGHVFRHHIPIYEHFGYKVEQHHDCVIDGHDTVFVIVSRKEKS